MPLKAKNSHKAYIEDLFQMRVRERYSCLEGLYRDFFYLQSRLVFDLLDQRIGCPPISFPKDFESFLSALQEPMACTMFCSIFGLVQ